MTSTHPAPRPGATAESGPGPNQWLKDHLDGVIDAELLRNWPAAADTPAPSRNGRAS